MLGPSSGSFFMMARRLPVASGTFPFFFTIPVSRDFFLKCFNRSPEIDWFVQLCPVLNWSGAKQTGSLDWPDLNHMPTLESQTHWLHRQRKGRSSRKNQSAVTKRQGGDVGWAKVSSASHSVLQKSWLRNQSVRPEVDKQSNRNRRRALRALLIFSSSPSSLCTPNQLDQTTRAQGARPGTSRGSAVTGRGAHSLSVGPFPCYKKSDFEFQSSSVPSSRQNRYHMCFIYFHRFF